MVGLNGCIALIDKYPWIDGIDIDWEYPGGSNDGERMPEDDVDEGCPIWESGFSDNQNFASLCPQRSYHNFSMKSGRYRYEYRLCT